MDVVAEIWQTMMRTEGRIWGTAFLLSYPFISIGLSTLCFVTGRSDSLTSLGAMRLNWDRLLALLVSAVRSEVAVLKYCPYGLALTPFTALFVFVWVIQK